jgi:hypothetical protein
VTVDLNNFVDPPSAPLNLFAHSNHAGPVRLVECFVDLLRCDLAARQCVEHPYLRDAARTGGPVPGLRVSTSEPNMNPALAVPADALPVPALPPLVVREVPPSHSHSPTAPAFNAGLSTHRTTFYGSPAGGDPAAPSPTFKLLPQPVGTAWPASTSMPNNSDLVGPARRRTADTALPPGGTYGCNHQATAQRACLRAGAWAPWMTASQPHGRDNVPTRACGGGPQHRAGHG